MNDSLTAKEILSRLDDMEAEFYRSFALSSDSRDHLCAIKYFAKRQLGETNTMTMQTLDSFIYKDELYIVADYELDSVDIGTAIDFGVGNLLIRGSV